jgi:hypothetical protein
VPSYTVTPEKFPAFFRERQVERYKRVVKAIRDTVILHGPEIAVHHTQALGKYAPINLGNYLRGWQAKDTEDGAVLFNDVPYADIIESGRRPNRRMPPTRVIEEWLEQKLRGRVKNRGKRRAQAKSLAFVVARAIGKRGLPGKHIMRKTKRQLDPMVRRAVREALE